MASKIFFTFLNKHYCRHMEQGPISTFESFEKIDFLRLQFLNKVPDRRFS